MNAISPDLEAAGQNLQQLTRSALDRVQDTANEFTRNLHATTQTQPTH